MHPKTDRQPKTTRTPWPISSRTAPTGVTAHQKDHDLEKSKQALYGTERPWRSSVKPLVSGIKEKHIDMWRKQRMKKVLIMFLTMALFLAGCGKNRDSSPQWSPDDPVVEQQESSPSETTISSEDRAIPGSYTIPDGWVKSEKYSTGSQLFYIEEGHEDDEKLITCSHNWELPFRRAPICS